jgi:predicted nucleic-acid-binding protein
VKALDTNILVRFLIQDDVNQANKVIQLFTKAEQNNEPLFIPLLVVLEVIWVLQSAYRVSRQDIVLAISNLLQMQVFEFENQGTLRDFIISANKNSSDLSDLLISQSAFSASCETTLTFDKKASRFELFTLL